MRGESAVKSRDSCETILCEVSRNMNILLCVVEAGELVQADKVGVDPTSDTNGDSSLSGHTVIHNQMFLQ